MKFCSGTRSYQNGPKVNLKKEYKLNLLYLLPIGLYFIAVLKEPLSVFYLKQILGNR